MRGIGIAFVLGALTLAAVPSPLPASARPACAPAKTKTIRSSHEARLYERTVPGNGNVGVRVLAGCSRSSGRRVQMARREGDYSEGFETAYAAVRLSGRYAALYSVSESSPQSFCGVLASCGPLSSNHVKLFDVARGRLLRTMEDSALVYPGLVLTRSGFVAWLVPFDTRTNIAQKDQTNQVRVGSASGERVVDAGPITASSLRTDGSVLRWTNAGVRHSLRPR